VSLLPPGNIKVRFFVPETELPRISLGQPVVDPLRRLQGRCAGARDLHLAHVEFTPPVIYSLDERSKLVFLIEARTDTPSELRVGQPVDVRLGEAKTSEAKTSGAKK